MLSQIQRIENRHNIYKKYSDKEFKQKDIPIDNKDTFYRISSIIVQTENSYVFHVRPIGPKFRTYNIEDTYYTNSTLLDVIKNIQNMKLKYNEFSKIPRSVENE